MSGVWRFCIKRMQILVGVENVFRYMLVCIVHTCIAHCKGTGGGSKLLQEGDEGWAVV